MKQLPEPRAGYRWEPSLVPLSDAAQEEAPVAPSAVPEEDPTGEAPAPAATHWHVSLARVSDCASDAPAHARDLDAPAAVPVADRRAHARVATIMRTGTLRSPDGRQPCVVKDVSPGGALIAGAHGHVPGEIVSLRIRGGCEAQGRIVRTDGDFVAIRFDREIDLRRLLGDGRRVFARSRAAMPQVELRRPALLDDGSGAAPVTIVRISQGGARIVGCDRAPAGAAVTLRLAGLAPVEARVTRFTPERLDLSFRRRLGFGELAAWLAAQPSDAAAAPPEPSRLFSRAAMVRPLRRLLPIGAICLLAVTLGARLAPAEAEPVPLHVNETWQPQLSSVRTMDEAMRVVPQFIARQKGTREERITTGISAFVRARFVHGISRVPVSRNWMLRLVGTVLPKASVPVLPDDILEHDTALCSQQSIVFQELLRRYGIRYASVLMRWPGPAGDDGHFALAAKVDGTWRFFDADEEIVQPGMPLGGLLSGRAVPTLYANRPAVAKRIADAARNGQIRVAYVDSYPAPRGAALQLFTAWMSSYGWLLLALASVVVRSRAIPVEAEAGDGDAQPLPLATAMAA